jgi:hypothetical protein
MGNPVLKRALAVSASLTAFFLSLYLSVPSSPSAPESESEGSHALEAFENWYHQRAAPYEKIPPGAFAQAARYIRASMPRESSLEGTSDTSQWTSIGPDNVGGRVLAVAVNPSTPNIVWIGAASGGLWKSTSAGVGVNAWTYVNTGQPTVAVSSIAIHPLNPNLMYIGTGEVGSAYGRGQVGTPGARSTYGMGVLKSVNGGATWTLTSLTFTFPQVTAVQKVLVNPSSTTTVFAITSEGTYKSVDAGSTWTLVHNVLMGMDIVINPADTAVLYACYGQRNSTSGKGIYKTTNGGASWTRLTALDTTNFGRTSLALSPSNPQTIYAGVAHGGTSSLRGLYRSTNGGTTWTLQTSTNYMSTQGWYDNVIAVHPTNPAIVLAAGLDIYKSTSNGAALTQKSLWYAGYDGTVPAGGPEGPPSYAHADHHAITYDPVNPSLVYFGSDGGVFASTDGGETFEGRNGGFVTTQFYGGFANAETAPAIALGGLQDNGTLKYEGTASWNKTYGGDGGWCAIDPRNADVMYEEYVNLTISKTTDGGTSWFGATSGLATGGGNANFIAPFVISPSHPDILYAGALVVYKTTNGAGTWVPTNGGAAFNGTPVACIGVSSLTPDTLIAATGSSTAGAAFEVFRSTNGGTAWTNVTGALPNRYPTDITFDPHSSLIAYITYSGYGTPHVFRSTNAGLTWNDISSNLPDLPAQTIAVDPLFPATLFAGTDLGVFRTLDGGGSWHTFDTGMPPAMVLDLAVSGAARELRAATFGNGIYERSLPAPTTFDYRALAFGNPGAGTDALVGAPISPITATFRNTGSVVPADSFTVQYRILNGPTTLYARTERLAPLAYGESRLATFGGAFTPAAPGVLTIQAISLAADSNASNDTLTGTINAVVPGTIASLAVLHVAAPYVEISGGTAGPSGDDAQSSLALPFPFTFDGYVYDQLQISTNGWAEFGTGTAGTERGLSTPAQIGLGNENGRLYNGGRPNKTMGAWYDDMTTDGGGDISSAVLGAAPHRVFVIQWRNVQAYFDVSTTTRLNFQIRLHEGTAIIEYNYGPVVAGTFTGSDIGAMVGLNDHLSGNYHFYDIALGGTSAASQGISTLSPLTDWPGPDSSYVIGPQVTSVIAGLDADWTLVSLPLTRTVNAIPAVFPAAIGGTAYRFNGSTYQLRDSLEPGTGYWAKFPSATGHLIWGNPLPALSVPVAAGWNLVGTVDHPVPAPAGGIVESFFFEYTSAGYAPVSTLQPGRGYWVKTSASGTLNIGPVPATNPVADLSRFVQVTISDRNGIVRHLYLSAAGGNAAALNRYVLPPPPPEGVMDIRYATQRLVEGYDPLSKTASSLPLTVSGASLPLLFLLGSEETAGIRLFVEEMQGTRVVASEELTGGRSVLLGRAQGGTFALRVIPGTAVPGEFGLMQNYPNPFNPSTRIAYALPVDSRVTISIFDITGREIVRLLDDLRPAGYGSVTWDATAASGNRVGSGVYFYRIDATGADQSRTFHAVHKMLLLK